MGKEQANYRLDAEAKRKAYAIFQQMGIKPTDAVSMFIHHVAMYGELPFKPSVPNAETIRALKEGERPERMATHTLEEFKRSLDLQGGISGKAAVSGAICAACGGAARIYPSSMPLLKPWPEARNWTPDTVPTP